MNILLILFFSSLSLADGGSVIFQGEALNDDNKIVYVEKHTLHLKNNTVIKSQTDYFIDQDNEPDAYLKSDFKNSFFVPEYEFADIKLKTKEEIVYLNGQAWMLSQDQKKEINFNSDEKVPYISGQGFHYFVQENLEQIIKDKIVKAKFILPKRQDIYSFQIKLKNLINNTVHLIFEPQSWIIRVFAPKMEVVYDVSSKRLIQYKGPSNILDSEGQIQNVTINYRY